MAVYAAYDMNWSMAKSFQLHCGWDGFQVSCSIAPNSHFSSLQWDHHLVVADEGRLWAVQGDFHPFLHTWTMTKNKSDSWMGIMKPCRQTRRIEIWQIDICKETHAVGRRLFRSSESWGRLRMAERSGWGRAVNSQQTRPRPLQVMHSNALSMLDRSHSYLLTWCIAGILNVTGSALYCFCVKCKQGASLLHGFKCWVVKLRFA